MAFSVAFKNCTVLVWSSSYLETVFEDGSKCAALFDFGSESRSRAAALGYGKNVALMHFDHELAHTFLAEARGLRFSPALARAAKFEAEPGEFDWAEEARVLAFQHLLNDPDTALDPSLDGFPAAELAARFKATYRQLFASIADEEQKQREQKHDD